MSPAPMLAMPDFTQPFVIETDASGLRIGAVLIQQGHPLSFISKALALKHHSLSTYEKELLAVVLAVVLALEKWRPYLVGRHFIIKTDHFSLKYILEQRITTTFQSKWLPKLLSFDYEIVYKKAKENVAADTLSRITGTQVMALTLSNIETNLLDKIKAPWEKEDDLQQLIHNLASSQQQSKYP